MSNRLRIILLIVLLITLLVIIKEVRSKKLELQYTITWLFLMVVLLFSVLFPDVLYALTDLVGITLPINMIFLLGFAFSLIVIYRLTVAVSKLSNETKELTQEIAILKKEKEHK